jgi:xanthosine utilization system XapX-like protein
VSTTAPTEQPAPQRERASESPERAQDATLGLLKWARESVRVPQSDDASYSAVGAGAGLLIGALFGLALIPTTLPTVLSFAFLGVLCIAWTGIGAGLINVFRRRFDPTARAYAKFDRTLRAIQAARLDPEQAERRRRLALDEFLGNVDETRIRVAAVDPPTRIRVAVPEAPPEAPGGDSGRDDQALQEHQAQQEQEEDERVMGRRRRRI